MKKKYNYIIVGAGIFGATCARLLTDAGKKCLVIERAASVGGMCSTQRVHDIDVHLFGAHDFYTENKDVWDFVNKYATFKSNNYRVMSTSKSKIYHMPVSMNTFYEMYGTIFPVEASKKIQSEIDKYKVVDAHNFEEQCIIMFGHTIYHNLIKPIYEKTYNRPANELPIDMSLEIPLRYVYNDLYHCSTYEGVPDEGYTALIENMLGDDIDVLLKTDFLEKREQYMNMCDKIIYTGAIDNFCNYLYGTLDWCSYKIDIKDDPNSANNLFGVPVIETPDEDELIKVVEHKWLTPWRNSEEFNNHNIITYLYKDKWDATKYTMFPLRNQESLEKYDKYVAFVEARFPNVIMCGRNAMYRPFNMAQSIELAMGLCAKLTQTA